MRIEYVGKIFSHDEFSSSVELPRHFLADIVALVTFHSSSLEAEITSILTDPHKYELVNKIKPDPLRSLKSTMISMYLSKVRLGLEGDPFEQDL